MFSSFLLVNKCISLDNRPQVSAQQESVHYLSTNYYLIVVLHLCRGDKCKVRKKDQQRGNVVVPAGKIQPNS